MKKILVLTVMFAVILSTTVLAASLTSVKINQIVQSGENLYVFFHAVDENENAITDLTADEIQIDLGGQALSAELESLGTEGIGYVFAIDVSSSLSEEQFSSVQECMKEWINAMGANDQAAIVTFGDEIVTVTDFTDNKNTLDAVINGLSANASGTMLYSGVMKAIDIAKRQSDSLPIQRVVVIMSDGLNESNDTASLSEMKDKAIDSGIPLYVAGVRNGDNGDKLTELGEVARATGGMIYTADKDELAKGFSSLSDYLCNGFIASVKIPAELADGSQKGLILTVDHNGISVDDSVDMRVKGIAESAAEIVGDDADDVDLTEESPAVGESTDSGIEDETSKDEVVNTSANEESSSSIGNSLETYSMYIYIGVGVLIAAGIVVYIIVMQRKRRDKEKKQNKDLDKGYGGTGGNGSKGTIRNNTGTMPIDDYDDPYTTMVGGVIVLTDTERGRSYSTQKKDRISVGRNEGNDIVIPDGKVSGIHCELVWDGGSLFVVDKESTNGTYLISNGFRNTVDSYSGSELSLGDELVIGDTRLELTDM
jgi:uncharacterized protein YegL/outer membrane murein-binding lipoprotein Lpp